MSINKLSTMLAFAMVNDSAIKFEMSELDVQQKDTNKGKRKELIAKEVKRKIHKAELKRNRKAVNRLKVIRGNK